MMLLYPYASIPIIENQLDITRCSELSSIWGFGFIL